jgi:transcriptional regulator with XRE-family HTH domain
LSRRKSDFCLIIFMDLHLRLKELCKSRGTSIAALESRLGMGNGTIGKWWKNGRVPNYANLSAVANALETTIAYLTGETDDPSAGIKKERPADGEARVCDLPESIQKIINICLDRPELASALLTLAQQIEKG